MSGITLITGGAKYSDLISRNFKQNKSTGYILADEVKEKQPANENSIVWNKRSPLSARNAVLSVLNRSGGIDDAVLCWEPGGFNKTFHETSSAVYDLQIDRWVKGYGYLLKEIIGLFIKQQHGRLSFILDTDGLKVMTPLESAIFNYLKSLVTGLSGLYQNEAVKIYCFESDTERRDSFIDFFNKTINDSKYTPGKIHRFTDRKGLFDFNRN